jgi:hypothetical protein
MLEVVIGVLQKRALRLSHGQQLYPAIRSRENNKRSQAALPRKRAACEMEIEADCKL